MDFMFNRGSAFNVRFGIIRRRIKEKNFGHWCLMTVISSVLIITIYTKMRLYRKLDCDLGE